MGLRGARSISYYAPLVFESAGWIGRDAILMTGVNAISTSHAFPFPVTSSRWQLMKMSALLRAPSLRLQYDSDVVLGRLAGAEADPSQRGDGESRN